jgi:hypothetical protein
MRTFDFDCYQHADGTFNTRIGRSHHNIAASKVQVPIAEYALDWTFEKPVELRLDTAMGLVVAVLPFEATSPKPWWYVSVIWQSSRTRKWGRCHAFIRRYGATMPLEMDDDRVVAALKAAELMQELAHLVVPVGEDDSQ